MNKRRWMTLVVPLWLGILLTGCSRPTTTATPPAPAATAAVVRPAWQEEWTKTMDAAGKEGSLVIYTGATPELRNALSGVFRDKFGIVIDWISGSGPEIAQKLTTERKAGLFLGDLTLIGPITALTTIKPKGVLAPIKPLLILPEVLDSKAYFDDEVPFVDNDRSLVIGHGPYVMLCITVNTDMVKPGEVTSYADLLSPKWNGKIVLNDPTVPGAGSTFFYITSAYLMNLDYHKQLVKQDLTIVRDWRQLVEWVAKGKYPIGLAPSEGIVADFQKAGAPIKWVSPREGAWLGIGASGSLSLLDKAPHPNAAKVFANWLLTKEGMTLWSKYNLLQGARKDISFEHLEKEKLRDSSIKYINANKEEARLKEREYEQLAKEIYAPLLK